jgi:glycosyltransferase involved in cell wall biosynthesis
MKLVWLSHFIPYPPRGGASQRTFNLLRCASQKHEVHLVAMNLKGVTPELASEYAQELRKHCAEVEIWETPCRWRGPRWWAHLALSPLYREHYGSRALWTPELGRSWEQFIAKHLGALIHFDSIDLARYFPQVVRFRKVLNHHNCESAMMERRAQKEPNPAKRLYLWHQSRKLGQLEARLCHQFDVNLTVSELDTLSLRKRNPWAHYHVVENGTDTDYFTPAEAEPEPKSLVFTASLRWYPNVSGILYFGREIWPLIKRACPSVRLYLAGRQPCPPIIQWARRDPSITVIPNPEDARPWLARGAVFICPIIDGGGTRLKILDAMAMGKAIVTTSIGSEGLRVKHDENILVADSPQDFANAVLHLLGNEALRKHLGTNGRALVEQLYSWGVIGDHLEEAYRCATRPRGGKQQVGGCVTPTAP